MAKKKKTLPKDFEELLKKNDLEEVKKVFETTEINARGGYGKVTALSFYNVSDKQIRWLVENDADLEAVDSYECTALHQHASICNGDVSVLLELGANANALDKYGKSPLHFASCSCNVDAVKKLLEYGANLNAVNDQGETPLEHGLNCAQNSNLVYLSKIAEIFLGNGVAVSQKMKNAIFRIGENFEFHRANFNKDYLEETDAALTNLYQLFDVPPVKSRVMHDGVSSILVNATDWKKQFDELWEYLVPSSSSAKTVQGEIIRIAGRICDEIYRNGGANWDKEFQKMGLAFVQHLSTQKPLEAGNIEKAHAIINTLNRDADDTNLDYLPQMAVQWVLLNPEPIPLTGTAYKR